MNFILKYCQIIGLSKERPILGDNRKAHSEKRCAFHEKQRFSRKVLRFSWKATLKTRSKRQMCVESAVFNDFRCFSYEKCNAFHEKCNAFHMNKNSWFNTDLSFRPGGFIEYRGKAIREKHRFSCEKCHFLWKAPLFKRPLARNCNPIFLKFIKLNKLAGILYFTTIWSAQLSHSTAGTNLACY